MAIPLLSSEAIRELDRRTIQEVGIPGPVLMEAAGRVCAEIAEELLPGERAGRVAVLCGKGNNGGDGMVAARHLIHAGHQVDLFLLADPKALQGDAALNNTILARLGVPVRVLPDEAAIAALDLRNHDLILDALLGTGLTHEVKGTLAAAIRAINASGVPVLAVDIPSGVSADSGQVCGVAVQARRTVTFAYPKPGQVLYPGAALCGDLDIVDIGIPPSLLGSAAGGAWLLTDQDVAPHLARRAPDAHKGRFGHLLVVAGSPDKPGAAGLCCRAAVRTGAGLVTLAGSPEVLARVVIGATEVMGEVIQGFPDLKRICAGNIQAVAIGPGLGTGPAAAGLVRQAVAELPVPMVVDADGLNNLVDHLALLPKAPACRILTPHPGEMARLLHLTTGEVQRDRLGCARQLAAAINGVVVLKGAGTVVAGADGTARVTMAGNPGMATGGTGDVLTGVIGALLCQGLDPSDAAAVGAQLHGAAGDDAVVAKGQHGLIASDLIEALPGVLRRFEAWGDGEDGPDDPEHP